MKVLIYNGWSFFRIFVAASLSTEFTSTARCIKIKRSSASQNQGGYHCSNAHDDVITTSVGWAMNQILPSWAVFNLDKQVFLHKLRFFSGITRNDHMMTEFTVDC